LAPLFERHLAKKVMKLKKFVEISQSLEIISALKLSSNVSSRSLFIQVTHNYLGQTQNLRARI
jgi:hypothetical protein